MNNEQQDLLNEAYENYLNNFIKPICPPNLDVQPDYYKPMTKEWFIKSAKEKGLRGEEFSEKWGLKIEERELSLEERYKLAGIFGKEKLPGEPYYTDEQQHSLLDELVPTKLITITYNDKKGESYE
jgi:hypothetical protein